MNQNSNLTFVDNILYTGKEMREYYQKKGIAAKGIEKTKTKSSRMNNKSSTNVNVLCILSVTSSLTTNDDGFSVLTFHIF